MEATLVTPGILPPIISTTPNSPKVCAKVSIAAVNTDALILGNKIYIKVSLSDLPKVYEACESDKGSCCKADFIGPIINGML